MDKKDLHEIIKYELTHHIGRTNAVERWWLVRKIFGLGADIPQTDDNINDRRIRRAIEILRREGMLICNSGDGLGWYLAGDEDEYRAFRQSYGSHAFPIMKTIAQMDKTALRQWPNALQPKLL